MVNFRIKWNFNIKASRRSEHRWFALAILLLTVTAIGSAQEGTSQDWVKLYEPHLHKEMPYRLMKPINFDASKRYPVIVSLHGAGGTGTDNRKQLKGWNKLLAEEQRRTDYPCYVLAPQANRLWNATHLQKIKDIIKDLPSTDMDRIYILGHSMGGGGTYRFIQIDPGYFAAAAPSAGSGRRKTKDFVNASLIKDIPIWAFHGDKDKVCPYERDQQLFAEMKDRGMLHKSPLPEYDLSYLPEEHRIYTVNAEESLAELSRRCPECRERSGVLSDAQEYANSHK